MVNEMITKFLEPTHLAKTAVKIEFKKRNTIVGIFVSSPDYEDLKAKNFWRIVSETHIPEWKKTNDNKYPDDGIAFFKFDLNCVLSQVCRL